MHKRLPILMVLCLVCIPSLRGSPPGQQPNQQPILKKPSKHSGMPIVGEFEGVQESPADQTHRQIREERYGDQLLGPLTDPGKIVDGKTETSAPVFIDYVATAKTSDPHGIPASVSTAVVVGTVMSGKCFVSKSRKNVYTDYQVRIDQVLKPDPTTNMNLGDVVTAARPGGAVHFPSGHVRNVLFVGHGLPEIGSQYILFLWKAIPTFSEYEIVIDSGYQLKDGKAYALDDANSEYDGMGANTLLATIQQAVSAKGGAQP